MAAGVTDPGWDALLRLLRQSRARRAAAARRWAELLRQICCPACGSEMRIVAIITQRAGVLTAWGVLLTPAVSAVLMSASTVVVAINAQLLKRTKL